MRIPHELRAEFPGEFRFIEQLARTNHEFKLLTVQYDEVNHQIYRIESEDEPTSDEVLEKFKKQRLKLKDAIATMLTKFERRM